MIRVAVVLGMLKMVRLLDYNDCLNSGGPYVSHKMWIASLGIPRHVLIEIQRRDSKIFEDPGYSVTGRKFKLFYKLEDSQKTPEQQEQSQEPPVHSREKQVNKLISSLDQYRKYDSNLRLFCYAKGDKWIVLTVLGDSEFSYYSPSFVRNLLVRFHFYDLLLNPTEEVHKKFLKLKQFDLSYSLAKGRNGYFFFDFDDFFLNKNEAKTDSDKTGKILRAINDSENYLSKGKAEMQPYQIYEEEVYNRFKSWLQTIIKNLKGSNFNNIRKQMRISYRILLLIAMRPQKDPNYPSLTFQPLTSEQIKSNEELLPHKEYFLENINKVLNKITFDNIPAEEGSAEGKVKRGSKPRNSSPSLRNSSRRSTYRSSDTTASAKARKDPSRTKSLK